MHLVHISSQLLVSVFFIAIPTKTENFKFLPTFIKVLSASGGCTPRPPLSELPSKSCFSAGSLLDDSKKKKRMEKKEIVQFCNYHNILSIHSCSIVFNQ